MTSIGEYAFSGCTYLKSVTIGNGVTSIGEYAFKDCGYLEAVYISDLEAWCGISFNTAYSNPLFYGKQLYLNGNEIKDLIVPEGMTSIRSWAFINTTLNSVTIPESVTRIGHCAFYGSSMTSAHIGSGVNEIIYSAFLSCNKLKSVSINSDSIVAKNRTSGSHMKSIFGSQVENYIIGEKVTCIGDSAFYWSSSLYSVTIGSRVTRIGKDAFMDCKSLRSVTINSASIISKDYTSKSNFKAIFGEQVKEYIIGEGVSWIGNYVFSGCSALTSITIPSSVIRIYHYAFSDCSGLTSVDIPEGVKSIGDGVFKGCSGLTSITIPNSVNYIGDYAFYQCTGLKEVYCYAEQVPRTESSAFDAFNIEAATLYVPASAVYEYQSNAKWKEFGSINAIIDDHYTQSPVQSISELVNAQVYTAETKRAAWYVSAGSNQMETTKYPNTVQQNSRKSSQQFAFILHNGKYYIYSVGEKKILNGITNNTPNHGTLVAKDCQPVTIIQTGDNEYPLFFSYGTSYNVNINSLFKLVIDSWTTKDDGNKVALRPVQGVTLGKVEMNRIIGYLEDVSIQDISLNQTSATLTTKGKTLQLSATVTPSNATDKSVIWQSSNTAVATVSSTGLVTAVANGTATITATTTDGSNLTATCAITVSLNNEINIDGIAYILDSSSGKATVTYNGLVGSLTSSYTGDIVIPTIITYGAIRYSVASIGDYAFSGCSGLKSITIPESVTSIGEYAFSYCSSLAQVIVKQTDPTAYSCSETTFYSNNTYATLYVPKGCIEVYSQCEPWSQFPNIKEIGADIHGDINADGDVDVADIVAEIDYVLSGEYSPLGDANQDGYVDVADIVQVIDYVLDYTANAPASAAQSDSRHESRSSMGVNPLSAVRTADGIRLALNSDVEYTAFQFTLSLSEGANLEDVLPDAFRTRNHSLLFHELDNGRYIVLVYATDNHSIRGTNGTLLDMIINGTGTAEISDVRFVTTSGERHRLQGITLEMSTDILEITADKQVEANCYDLNGRRITIGMPRKGIFIKDGKKMTTSGIF